MKPQYTYGTLIGRGDEPFRINHATGKLEMRMIEARDVASGEELWVRCGAGWSFFFRPGYPTATQAATRLEF